MVFFCPLWKAAKHSHLSSDEEYTWVLTPEKLRYGVGTYYITAVLDRSKEGARQMPSLFSVVTAVTQCYFWDSLGSMWRSSGCQVRSCPLPFLKLVFIEIWLLYNIVLVSAIQKSQPHTHPLPPTSLGHRGARRLSFLCFPAGSHELFHMWKCIYVTSLQSCPALCDPVDYSPPGSLGKNPGVGCHALLQGIFPGSIYMSILISKFVPFAPCAHMSILCICISSSALEINSSVPFF